jgi:thiol-disulfide isomerase/thioredoxin
MKRILAITLLLFAALAPAAFAKDAVLPVLKVTTLDGKAFDLAAHRGHWVVVNFWATWCAPCIKEMPDISRFIEQHKGVDAIGLAYDDSDRKDVLAFVQKHPVVYPIAQVDTFNPPADFDEPRGLPTTYLIAPDGKVAKKFVGPVTGIDLAKAIGTKP